MAEVEHCLICRKNNEEFFTIKAGVFKDYRSPMICEVQGEKNIFLPLRLKKYFYKRELLFFRLNQRNVIEKKSRYFLADKTSREFFEFTIHERKSIIY